MPDLGSARLEFHVSRLARDRYEFEESLFSYSGNVILANFHAARVFAQKMNERRDLVRFPEQAVQAGQINSMGLIDEILHHVVARYRRERNPNAMREALSWLNARLGKEAVDRTLLRFALEFPPLAVYRREVAAETYLEGQTGGVPHREMLLEELLMLWLTNENPALLLFGELFEDSALSRETAYAQALAGLYEFFETQPPFGPDNQNLIDLLMSPARAHPHSLEAQLEYLRQRWGVLLGAYLYRLLGGLDLIREEEKAIFLGPGPAQVYEFAAAAFEPERFSRDLDWMPTLVLIAKNAYVWLHQLSQKYKRLIGRLDEIPDEELEQLARWGISGLWLIGLWERSPASRKIKQLTGNPEAVASAYSLYDYQVAADLGGAEAFEDLKGRAWQRGIRMASDMVPNHVGIYSRWVVEHPDWFIGLEYSPFPSHSFNGPDLSEDERVGIFIEDHYYDRSDAAVVFKRVDRWTGAERYIYHGNDGTSMPWNDTAQLNYLNPELREAAIQTILHVARQTPVIRFDAAMTLAKKHFQRLWFPEPGTGGAIPTRAEHGLTKEQFDAAMPEEFWREVVDRVAAEAPDTLLLAEAFWLLEGYFVRTLGMHRVYNSAFMNMLRDEDNAKYRLVIKNTLEFDPEILKRFVNFMNNPDEDTAVDQFGKGDKYFGICTLMATLPGLPMLGHGQVEGYAEKYGMEYRRAYWDEQPDGYLVGRHEREIFPLLHRRHLFAEAEGFRLYDFFAADGSVNEDVFAYSNRAGDERALVVYHNRYARASGWIRSSAAYSVKTGEGDLPRASQVPFGEDGGGIARRLVQQTLGEGLGLAGGKNRFYLFRDHITGLEYIRNGRELREQGMYVELEAYKCHVFLDWREVEDNEWHEYAHLEGYLNGRGVPSIEEARREVFLRAVHDPFLALVNAVTFRRLIEARVQIAGAEPDEALLEQVEAHAQALGREIKAFARGTGDEAAFGLEIRRKAEACLCLGAPGTESGRDRTAWALAAEHLGEDLAAWGTLLGWLFSHALGKLVVEERFAERSRSWIDEWLLGKLLAGALRDLGLDEGAAWWAVGTVKILTSRQGWFERAEVEEGKAGQSRPYRVLAGWLRDRDVQQFLQVNRYRGELWFNHEAFEQLLGWMLAVAVVGIEADTELEAEERAAWMGACCDVVKKLEQAEARSGYRVLDLMDAAME